MCLCACVKRRWNIKWFKSQSHTDMFLYYYLMRTSMRRVKASRDDTLSTRCQWQESKYSSKSRKGKSHSKLSPHGRSEEYEAGRSADGPGWLHWTHQSCEAAWSLPATSQSAPCESCIINGTMGSWMHTFRGCDYLTIRNITAHAINLSSKSVVRSLKSALPASNSSETLMIYIYTFGN